MDASAGEATEPAPQEPGSERFWRRGVHRLARLRLRIPTAVFVALLGIVLSAWLLPAFTRQWDDRQKANELKVSLVSDISAASANAIADGEQIRPVGGGVLQAHAVRAWAIATLELEARLRAYYSPQLVAIWRFFSYAIDRYVGRRLNGYFDSTSLADPADVSEWLTSGYPETTLRESYGAYEVMAALLDVDRSLGRGFLSHEERQVLRVANLNHYAGRKMNPEAARQKLGSALTLLAPTIVYGILREHPAGYSTTKRDLIHDLFPF
jgi:hypothetical protein